MRRAGEAFVTFRAADVATIEQLLAAALLLAVLVALYATWPLWSWEKRHRRSK